jgi:Mn2+/Fe2+ NRAMP family transporter
MVAVTAPPAGEAALQAVWPDQVDVSAIVTLVGGTIGGYIMFSGAHRLLEGGVTGADQVTRISLASVQGIVITGIMRSVLFLAVLGVIAGGATLSSDRPVFDAFRLGAGNVGFVLSALIFWSAAITSVVGCAYTAISFLGRVPERRRRWLIVLFTSLSLAATIGFRLRGWSATRLLIAAGTLNGVLLPVVLGVVLVAAYRHSVVGAYRHPLWAALLGGLAWIASLFLAYHTVANTLQ